MKFSRIAPFFIGVMSAGLLAVAVALPAEKRQSDILTTVLDLVLSLVSTVLSLLGGLGGLTTLTSATSLTPVIGELSSVLNTATSSISLLNTVGGLLKRADPTQDSQTVAQVVTNIATALEPLTENPNLSSLLPAIVPADTSLSGLLDKANAASSGILPLVAQDLTPQTVTTLQELNFTQTLGNLGI